MNAAASQAGEGGITPPVHLEFIQNQLENPGASAAAATEIEQYHRALFMHHHAVEWEQARQKARTHAERLAFLEGRLKETELSLSERPGLVPVMVDGREDTAPSPPWNAWELVHVRTLLAGDRLSDCLRRFQYLVQSS